ncbi:VIT1/CCC1 transporter family protein [Sulfitobacter sp. D35]|uniref:VIT1/CCC1 transporter family protein n=1 Tax=Sulfitobacter sp. D35 TaxID=3083252 RepID=UPI00296F9BC7|nr:VIT1/CCC1 transporter family protein [Sulfitobacter sp. D35]MDW4499602.1 VIT1/CCC1 transporter family protein [Sulfitobacter sp. D35]
MPKEGHYINRSNWLRAAMLGANDGIVSTASLLVGVAAAGMDRTHLLLAGLAGLTAGALSMASGEYISVSTQADVEAADLERERLALHEDAEYELGELADGLSQRGVDEDLALTVAQQMTDHDALDAHAREELGMNGLAGNANPITAAAASGLAFAAGAAMPVTGAFLATPGRAALVIPIVALLALGLLGALGARLGGTPVRPSVLRVLFWGCFAMTVSSGVGWLFGVAV